jgi:SAM-dependent methyltransferase
MDKAAAKKLIPGFALPTVERLWFAAQVNRSLGGKTPRRCPICKFFGRFTAFGNPPRYDARCRRCGSLERHRLFKLWLDRELGDLELGRILHFAPEPALEAILRKQAGDYKSADLEPGKGDLVLDVERIDLPPDSVDTVFCSHVLEHVDDEAALRELFRVLAPGGLCLLMVPIVEGWVTTYQNASIGAGERTLHFGQWDHVRYYGADFRDRVRGPGFTLTEFTAIEPDVSQFGLVRGEKLFIARKP